MGVVDLLAQAIAQKEGWFAQGTNIPKERNNPGDLDYAGQIGASRAPIGSPDPDIAIFADSALGIAALYRQLWLQVAEGQTVTQIVYQWAPPSENNSAQYLRDVLAWTKLPANVPVLNLLTLTPEET